MKGGRGFTLIEMMLAMVLVAVGTVAALELFQQAQAGSTDGEFSARATYLSQECLEALRNQTYAGLTVGSGVLSSVSGCGSSASGLPQGSRSVTVTEPYVNQLKRLAVTISWTGIGSGSASNVVLYTYVSNI